MPVLSASHSLGDTGQGAPPLQASFSSSDQKGDGLCGLGPADLGPVWRGPAVGGQGGCEA